MLMRFFMRMRVDYESVLSQDDREDDETEGLKNLTKKLARKGLSNDAESDSIDSPI
jgi:hypothetical protein